MRYLLILLVLPLVVSTIKSQSFTGAVWHFDEPTGDTAYDSSPNGNSACTAGDGTGITAGHDGLARQFSGYDWLEVHHDPSLTPPSRITVEGWIYPTEVGFTNRDIVSKESGYDSGSYQLFLDATGRLTFGLLSGYPWQNVATDFSIPENSWTHFLVSFDNATKEFRIFINEILVVDEIRNEAYLSTSDDILYIGRNGSDDRHHFIGLIDELRILHTAAFCCEPPTVGDLDQSGEVDITDISLLIDNQFLTLAPLPCDEEGDVDYSGGVDITDLSVLIDNQFLTLTPLQPCP